MKNQIRQLQVAVSGYDAVAYFDGKAIAGDPAFSSVHDDSLYLFTSEANKQKFDADPAYFIPLYGGYCATAASEGKLFGVDPTNFKITGDKRLALFYRGAGGDTLPQWNANEAERRAAADKHWREASFEPQA
jgi:YHS domain-containing protein